VSLKDDCSSATYTMRFARSVKRADLCDSGEIDRRSQSELLSIRGVRQEKRDSSDENVLDTFVARDLAFLRSSKGFSCRQAHVAGTLFRLQCQLAETWG